MKRLLAGFASILLFCAALPADAQGSARDRAIKRCNDNRGTDCKTEQGLKPWIDEETAGQHRPVVGAKRPASPGAAPQSSSTSRSK